ncbi:MAG: hypothetical protein LIQ31_11120 [Planctomycetes bacterium]|nr:hypothetical protein [Planctomycetota bacterium]
MDIRKSGGTLGLMDLLGLSRKNASKLDDESAGTFAQLFLQCLMGGAAGTETVGGVGASGETSGAAISFMERDVAGWAGFQDKVADSAATEPTGGNGTIREEGIRAGADDGRLMENDHPAQSTNSEPRFTRWTDAAGPWDVYGAGLSVWKDPDFEREYRDTVIKNAASNDMASVIK